jgi:tetratricopeptide (TPR) repeat protein
MLVVFVAGVTRAQPAAPTSGTETLRREAKEWTEAGKYLEAEKLARQAVGECEKNAAERANDPTFLAECARCRNAVAEIHVRMCQFRQARDELVATAAALEQQISQKPDAGLRLELARTQGLQAQRAEEMGRTDEAIASLDAAVALVRKLALEDPARPEYRLELVELLVQQGNDLMRLARWGEAEAAFEEAVKGARQLVSDAPSPDAARQLALACDAHALLMREAGQFLRAVGLLRETIRVLSKLQAEYPDRPEYWRMLPSVWRNLAHPLQYQGYAGEAAAAQRTAARLEGQLSRLAPTAHSRLTEDDKIMTGLLANDLRLLAGKQAETERVLRQAQQEAEAHPEVVIFQTRLVAAKMAWAGQFMASGKKDLALAQAREALDVVAKLAAEHADVLKVCQLQATAWELTGFLYFSAGKRAEGEQQLAQALSQNEKLAQDFPGVPALRYRVAETRMKSALALGGAGETKAAARAFADSVAVLDSLAKAYPQSPEYRRQHAQATMSLGNLWRQDGAETEAEAAFRESVRLWQQAVADFPANEAFRFDLANTLEVLAAYLIRCGRAQEVAPILAEMVRIDQGLVKEFADQPGYRAALAHAYLSCGIFLDEQHQPASAVEYYTQSLAWLDSALQTNPRQRDWREATRVALKHRASALVLLNKRAEQEADEKRIAELDEALQSPALRLMRVQRRLADGKPAEALREADDLLGGGDLSGAQWHELAVVYAQAAAANRPDREALAARAVLALGQALEQGHDGPLSPDQEPAFRLLATRADFQKLAKK